MYISTENYCNPISGIHVGCRWWRVGIPHNIYKSRILGEETLLPPKTAFSGILFPLDPDLVMFLDSVALKEEKLIPTSHATLLK